MFALIVVDGSEQHLYSSPNVSYIPDHRTGYDQHLVWKPATARRNLWLHDKYPFLALIPQNLRFSGPIFARLAGHYNSFLVRKYGDYYALDRDLSHSWTRLEYALTMIAHKLLKYKAPKPMLADYESYTPPSRFYYSSYFRTQEDARRHINKSRDAFVPLMAEVSWAILMSGSDVDEECPGWMKYVLDELKVHPGWVRDLRESIVADFGPTNIRRGAIVYVSRSIWRGHVKTLVDMKIPVWIYWGTSGSFFKCPEIDPYRPSQQEMSDALARAGLSRMTRYHPVSRDPDLAPSSVFRLECSSRTLPAVEAGSGQISADQTWTQFFEVMERRNEERARRETDEQKERRLAREKGERSGKPGKRGPRVYRWVQVGGYRIRTRVPRGQVSGFWDVYRDSQKRYNSFDDEWDVCTEFDPDWSPADELDHGEEECLSVGMRPPSPPPQDGFADLTRRDFTHVYTSDLPPISDSRGMEGLKVILYNRYGFTCDANTSYEEDIQAPSWEECRKLLSDMTSSVEPWLHRPIRNFVSSLLRMQHLPTHLDDFHPKNTRYLGRLEPRVRISTVPLQSPSKTWYRLEPEQEDPVRWQFIVTDPAAVVECIRRGWGSSVRDLVDAFVDRGISFTTRILVRAHWMIQHPEPGILLGTRPSDYIPDAGDYTHYEHIRDTFLKSQRRARVALMQGGIVWRLVKETLGSDDVLRGPLVDEKHGPAEYGCQDMTRDGDVLWDDSLSVAETDLICGVYHVYDKDKCPSGSHDFCHRSWWPKKAIWDSSPLNVGYWSPMCEEWFQRQLRDIRNGQARLLTSTKWKSRLRWAKGMNRIPSLNQSRAESRISLMLER